MTELTVLDKAHAKMEAAPDDDAARLGFFEVLAASEVFLMLEAEVESDRIRPETFDLADGTFVLAFDREDRMTQFAGRAVPYAALSGRGLVSMLAGQELGLGVNIDVAPSSILLPAEAVDWLVDMLDHGPEAVEDRIREIMPPSNLSDGLLTALDSRLAAGRGLARAAYLVQVAYSNGDTGHLLGIVDAKAGAEQALAQSVNEALSFSGLSAGWLDVAFLSSEDPVVPRIERTGLKFDLPTEAAPNKATRVPPGSDPDKPPILR